MPPAGPNFARLADFLSGTGTENQTSADEHIRALYSFALYEDWFTLDVMVKGEARTVRFIPGHIWISDRANGPRQRAKVMVIGKMPGPDEVRAKRNWVGKSGDIFMDALERVGVTPETFNFWYVTNVLKYGHPAPWLGSAISTEWFKDCRPLLQMEMRLVRPDYILCLGSEAGKELLGQKGAVNTSAGKVFDYEIPLADGTVHVAKVMTCIHPAAVARTPDLQPQLDGTLRLFTRLASGESVGAEETDIEHITVDTEEEALAVLDRMIAETASGGAIAIDCEWHGEFPEEPGAWLRTIQVSHKAKFALCIVLRAAGNVPKLCDSTRVKEKLNELYACSSARNIRAVGHFHRADLPWLIHYGLDIRKQFEAPANPRVGWEDTKEFGGFDTGVAAHSVCETDEFKLEVLATRLTGCPRYDTKLQEVKKQMETALKKPLEGYGDIPDDVLNPYACYDVDVTRRLFDVYNGVDGKPGLLDCDDYGNNSRIAFWITSRAAPACLEMEQTGIVVDMKRAEQMLDMYMTAKVNKLLDLRTTINWPNFNLDSPFDVRELLFGHELRGQTDKVTGLPKRASPPEAKLCYLSPVKATGNKTKKSWDDLVLSGEAKNFSPGTDKESLGILFHQTKTQDVGKIVGELRDLRFIGQLLKTTLKPPGKNKDGGYITDDEGNRLYEKGLLSYVGWDQRIRTHIFQTLETGRYASARPNLQNISKRRESDYKRILGGLYKYTLRSIFVASPGHVLIEADYLGAELAGMAWMSGDTTMCDHVRRAQLPENHPDYYDIHSAVAVSAFRLDCEATKAGLKRIGKEHLRIAAKNVVFGYAYGRGAEAIARQAKEEGITISVDEAQALIDGLVAMYPMLPMFFASCRDRTKSPGWICNCFGRFRRFRTASDNKVEGEQGRQAMNFGIQSLVADAMSRALDHLYYRREAYGLHYKIALQIHDAVLLECPIEEVEAVYDKVLPECMTDLVDVWPADLNGYPLECEKAYHMGIDREIMLRWGEKVTKEDCRRLGIPERFGKG
jgi:uracil-DNA glycosylase family 4